jgi:hypothetical protein
MMGWRMREQLPLFPSSSLPWRIGTLRRGETVLTCVLDFPGREG